MANNAVEQIRDMLKKEYVEASNNLTAVIKKDDFSDAGQIEFDFAMWNFKSARKRYFKCSILFLTQIGNDISFPR